MPIESHSNLNSIIPLPLLIIFINTLKPLLTPMKKEEPTEITYIQYPETNPPLQPETQTNNIPSEVPIKRRIFTGRKSKSGYNWSDTENRQYLRFLMNNKGVFDLPLPEKKKLKINVILSKKIPTRNSTQCHSHHQKMMVKYGSVEKIIYELNQVYNIQLGSNKKGQVFIKMEEALDHIKIYYYEEKKEQKQSGPDVKLENQ